MARRALRPCLLGALVVTVIILGFAATSVTGEDLGPSWSSGGLYHGSVELQSCVPDTIFGYVYCIGGFDGHSYTNAVYRAPVSSSGSIGSWSSASSYPVNVAGQSCGTYTTFLYCVGGFGGASRFDAVYFFQLNATGLGSWAPTTSYPVPVELQSCVIYAGYIYCVGGFDGLRYYSTVYTSRVSPGGGLASWSNSTKYPLQVEGESCAASSGYLYCVGGDTGTATKSAVYFAAVSSGGIGAWQNTTSYPTTIYDESCAASGGYIYCVGGYTSSGYSSSTYYAQVLPSGMLGPWTRTTSYPSPIILQSCFVLPSSLYCIGGFDGNSVLASVYYDTILPPSPVTVTQTNTVTQTSTLTTTLTSSPTTTVTSSTTITSISTTSTVSIITLTSVSRGTTTISSTVTSTRTTLSLSVSTTTVSSATTVTTQVRQESGLSSGSLLWTAGAAAAGLVLGVLSTLIIHRRRGANGSDSPED